MRTALEVPMVMPVRVSGGSLDKRRGSDYPDVDVELYILKENHRT